MNTYPPLVDPAPELTPHQTQRYARHAILPELGTLGQRRLLNAKVLVIGAGGLGSPILLYLAAAGIGHLGIIDDDTVDLSNLQRQIIHTTNNIGTTKVDSARTAITDINPTINITTYNQRLTPENALDILTGWDIIVDGTDNFATRYLIADATEILNTPCVWGAILRFDGQLSTFWPGKGPVYRDLFPEPPDPNSVPSCAQAGVLGALCASIGSAMAMEVIRLITGIGTPLIGRLMIHNALTGTWNELTIHPDPNRTPTTTLTTYPTTCTQPPQPLITEHTITPTELHTLLDDRANGTIEFTLIDVREPTEHELVTIDGATLIPKNDIITNPQTVPSHQPAILFCKSGTRSTEALTTLLNTGRDDVWHLQGGILAWIEHIEPHKPRY